MTDGTASLRGTPVKPLPAWRATVAAGGPATLGVGLFAGAVWLAFDVRLAEAIAYVAYEAAFVVIPGVLAFCALVPRRAGPLWTAAVGWALGYALELAAFVVTAALGVRGWLIAYPVVVTALAVAVLWKRRAHAATGTPPRASTAPAWLLAGVCALTLTYLAGAFFTTSPRPDEVASVAYHRDVPFHISIAAEARHHWPPTDPSLFGRSLDYHVFSHLHMAAVNQVTGLDLSVVFLRLVPVPWFLLIVLQLAALGRQVGGAAGLAPLAAGLAFVAGELDLDPGRMDPFNGALYRALSFGPSLMLGSVLFLAAVILVYDRLEGRERPPAGGELIVLVALLAAAAGAKAMILPLMMAGLGALIAWQALVQRRLDRRALAVLGLVGLVFAGTYLAIYRGSGDASFEPGLFHLFNSTVAAEFVAGRLSGAASAIFWALAGPAVLLLLLVPLAGAAFVVRERGRELGAGRAFLLSLLVAGVGMSLVIRHSVGAQLYFLLLGYVVALPVSAEGLGLFWKRWREERERPGVTLAALIALVVAGALAAGAAAFNAPLPAAGRYLLAYAGVAAVIALAVALAFRGRPRHTGLAAGLGLTLVIAVTVVDRPLDHLWGPLKRLAGGGSVYSYVKVPQLRGMDAGLYSGLRWIRDHTPPSAVLAVNNHYADDAHLEPMFDYYSAFSERRVFIQSWLYRKETFALGYDRVKHGLVPFPGRLRMNQAAYRRPGVATLTPLLRRGVDYLVVDRLNERDAPALGRLARPLFSNRSMAVFDLRGLVAAARRRAARAAT